MKILEVTNSKTRTDFIKLPYQLYSNDPNWIPHIESDIEAIFDPGRNSWFEFGIATRWVLYDEKNQPKGRIAAFINRNIAYTHEQATGGVGFFECTDNQNAANLLFDIARNWLQERGMEAMDGPINFGERDRFWGLLTDGFQTPPPYTLNYNPPYYRQLFENYGFQNYFEQYVYELNRETKIPDLVSRIYERLTENGGYRFESLQLKHLKKYKEDFRYIFNEAWGAVHKDFKPMTPGQVQSLFQMLKPVLDPELIIFAYHNDKPVAIFVGIPELNEIFRFVNGKLNAMGKIRFLYHKWKGTCRTVYGVLFGVIPDHHNKGVESGLIISIQKAFMERNRYDKLYLSWIGDYNPKMIRIAEILTTKKVFTLITYRKLFKKDLPFTRHSVIH